MNNECQSSNFDGSDSSDSLDSDFKLHISQQASQLHKVVENKKNNEKKNDNFPDGYC